MNCLMFPDSSRATGKPSLAAFREELPTNRAELRMRTRVPHNGCSGLMAGTDLSEQSRGTLIDSRLCFSSLRTQFVLCLGKFTPHEARPWGQSTARVVLEST